MAMPVLADCNMQHLIKCYRSSNERAAFMEKEKKKLARYKGQPQKCVKGFQFLSLEMGSSAQHVFLKHGGCFLNVITDLNRVKSCKNHVKT